MAGLDPTIHAVERGPAVITRSTAPTPVVASRLAKQSRATSRTSGHTKPQVRDHA